MDLLSEILVHLPVKDVLRSKGVCKAWKSLICEPQFCYKHTLGLCLKHKRNPNPYPSGIFRQVFQRYPPPATLLRRIDITLFTHNSSSFTRRIHDCEIRHCEIQQSCNDQFGHEFHPISSKPFLVFEPWKSPHYKIIFFSKVDGDGNGNQLTTTTKMKMSVYSSATGSWSKLDLLPSFPNNINYIFDGVYCNGAIHWHALGENSVHFDIDSICLKTLPTSHIPSHELEVVYFGGCGRNLHLILGKRHERSRYNIWELKEDYSAWIARYYVDLSSIEPYGFHFEVKCVVRQPPKEDEEEESALAILIVNLQKFVAYNLKDHSSRIFYEEPTTCGPHFHHQYFETLAGI
ncbi:hypothetical protein PIB30_075321 [Stylosanthes scabra]|uniref:F-box domain-containing protein n=1 Tax=Stylosanthes scabra TaxID=79078 RepID=A0ABU6YMH3_9FABA|nr:hypothetical protein [Stylosanthes scabra]